MTTSDTWLVVGLGNPGADYARNRHNVGAMAVDVLARRAGTGLRRHKARADAAEVRVGVLPAGAPGPRAVLAVPASYMNESGGPVKALMSFYKVPPSRLVVIHDELDIPFAASRVKVGGGEGGHNGLRSISRSVGTQDYVRVRLGIGRPPGRQDPADFVLKDFGAKERPDVDVLLEDAADIVEDVLGRGVTFAQDRWNAR
ncbi:aminoacyl-tRNA hydrolase [Arsenicicoccus sp. oral taxon 190]|uniref:aminoacyl-tRNA hydrolase n=1 Tax=Arsenicicoccus sp. oral taxon 190 TaxID=1658671 RepID=UPI00067A34AB|nr:aminoacyl-tRNA hydrolase [Arsenicicoccus sp. oral taxon 190]AKT50192.1 peptidyl-tRNA hydrolase [Arsenicicoccus sp. oral taxon 190]